MKSYTDLEQSKVLSEILPLESADGFWSYHDKLCSEGDEWEGYEDYPRAEPYLEYTRKDNEWKEDKSDIPCWSLAALLGILPEPYQMTSNKEGKVQLMLVHHLEKDYYDNPVDACYEMILKTIC